MCTLGAGGRGLKVEQLAQGHWTDSNLNSPHSKAHVPCLYLWELLLSMKLLTSLIYRGLLQNNNTNLKTQKESS